MFLTGNKHRKLESEQQSKVHPEKGQKMTDPTEIFCLPQYIRVMVLNYQPLQTIFAIDEGECHKQALKTDEQFSPMVTIVNTETRQPLDCVLLLHGEKPPEVNCRTLFCYIAVQVAVVPKHDSHNLYPHPLCHMESKPIKQSKLPLIFCFHQPGTVCVIQLSVHSIVDSEGVEYMYNSEDCTCVVQIIDHVRHGGEKMTVQHGVVRIKEPPRLRYTGPLTGERFHKLEKHFIKLYLSPDYKQILQLSKPLIDESSISPDIKVFALCWEALTEAFQSNHKHAEEVLGTAWEKASQLECKNGLLLQGRVLKHLAFMQYAQGNDNRALDYVSLAKERLFNAAPSSETAHALYTEILVRRRKLFSEQNCTFSSQLQECEEEYKLLLEHAMYMEEYEKGAICSFLAMKASFHLRSDMITDELPPKVYWPSSDDLRKAEECLNSVSLDMMQNQSNFYTAKYYRSLCDLHVWKHQCTMAMHYLEKAREVRIQLNGRMCKLDQRHKLLERLTGDDKIDEILKKNLTCSNSDVA